MAPKHSGWATSIRAAIVIPSAKENGASREGLAPPYRAGPRGPAETPISVPSFRPFRPLRRDQPVARRAHAAAAAAGRLGARPQQGGSSCPARLPAPAAAADAPKAPLHWVL